MSSSEHVVLLGEASLVYGMLLEDEEIDADPVIPIADEVLLPIAEDWKDEETTELPLTNRLVVVVPFGMDHGDEYGGGTKLDELAAAGTLLEAGGKDVNIPIAELVADGKLPGLE